MRCVLSVPQDFHNNGQTKITHFKLKILFNFFFCLKKDLAKSTQTPITNQEPMSQMLVQFFFLATTLNSQ